MIKVGVIGANGYLARNFLFLYKNSIKFHAYGHEEYSLDGYLNYSKIDVFSDIDMQSVVENNDIIYFFTGKTGTLQGFEQHDEFLDLNIRSLICLLNSAKKYNPLVKIVFPSTRLVYKGSENKIAENAEKQLLTPYALQKFMCEKYLIMYNNLYNISYSIARISVPYGSHVKDVRSYGTIDFFINQIREKGCIKLFGDGEQRRTFTYIDDLCNDLFHLGTSKFCSNEIYNIGGDSLSLKQLANMIVERYGGIVDFVEWPKNAYKIESGSTIFDSSKLDCITGKYKKTRIVDWLKGDL